MWQFVAIVVLVSLVKTVDNKCKFNSTIQEQCVCLKNNVCTKATLNVPIRLNYTIKDYGIDVSLTDFDLCANVTYRAQLIIYESINSSDKCSNNRVSKLNKTYHSHLKLNGSCIACDNETPTASFDYIFSGCYVLEILKDNVRMANSNATYITTNYTKSLIDNVFDVRDNFREMVENKTIIEVIMASHEIKRPPNIFTNLCEINCKLDNCINIKSMTEITYKNSELNENFSHCSPPMITSFCNYSKDSDNYITYLCNYWNLRSGKYIFQFRLLGEFTRCNLNSIWTESLCERSHEIDVPSVQIVKSNHSLQPSNPLYKNAVILTSLLMSLVLITAVYMYKKFSCNQRQFDRDEETDNMLSPQVSTPTHIKNEVLIIHARDLDLFTEMLESLKHILSSFKNTKVYDFNTCGQESFLDEDWIRAKISNIDTKVILFLNKSAIILFCNPKIVYAQPRREDKFFVYAIKQLHSTKTRNHKNFFVVGLANCCDDLTISLNPEARYLMPNNVTKLLLALFGQEKECDEHLIEDFNEKCEECSVYQMKYLDYHKTVFKYT